MLVTVPFKKMYSGDRPVIVLDNGLSALIDTGAENNVWYTAGNLLKHIGVSQNVTLHNNITGVTGHSISSEIYTIDIRIGGLLWKNAHMLFPLRKTKNTVCDMILGVSMFQQMHVNIDFMNRKITLANFQDSNICMDSRRKMKDADNKTVYLINNIWTQEAGSSLTQESDTDGKG